VGENLVVVFGREDHHGRVLATPQNHYVPVPLLQFELL
jgi:hypothetical protein